MELFVELGVDFIQMNDWGWDIYSLILSFHMFFRHRGHQYLPGNLTLI